MRLGIRNPKPQHKDERALTRETKEANMPLVIRNDRQKQDVRAVLSSVSYCGHTC